MQRTRAAGCVLAVLVLAGCASRPFTPTPGHAVGLSSRAVTKSKGSVRVSASVPDAKETESIFGVPLYESGLQPVWLEIENQGDEPVRLALVSLDPDYFSPLEVAYMHHKGLSNEGRASMEAWFHEHGMARRVLPGETRSGFVITHLDPGTKAFNVDLFGNHEDYFFTFFVSVPGFTPDHAEVDFADLYEPDEVVPLDLDGLRRQLSTLQCCSTDESGERAGGPFNVVFVGSGTLIARALMRAGWEETAAGSAETSVARSHRYRGRRPDATFHRVLRGGSQRTGLRIWLSPMQVDDQPVWLGQIANEMRRTGKDGTVVDSRADPDIDAARTYLLQSLWYSQSLEQVGFTAGGGAAPIDAPRTGFTGAEFFTDGLREVLWIAPRPLALDETVVLDWEKLRQPPGETTTPLKLRGAPPPNDRLHTRTERDVRVTTAVPSAEEAEGIFGVKPYRRNIQPVWIKIENLGQQQLFFFPLGLDTGYYAPLAAAYQHHGGKRAVNEAMDRSFWESGMGLGIEPGGVRTGYVFSRLDQGTKSFNVDVVSARDSYRTTFFVPVPGLRIDHYAAEWDAIYPPEAVIEHDLPGLIRALEALPCCTSDKKNKHTGDPLNLVMVGSPDDVFYALMRAGWDETETVYGKSMLRTTKSFLSGGEYRYSPVSALYAFDRAQDVAMQKARASIHERNHLRLWLAPFRFEGKHVWIGQISRDIGVRFSKKTITTHKIDPDVDETREYLVEDLAYAQSLARFGYLGGVGAAPIDAPRGNLTGDPYFTDGHRVVMWVSSEPVDIAEIDAVDLETPTPPR